MQKITSKDGTAIAFDRQGTGPAVILVDGALNCPSGGSNAELAGLLAPHFTVIRYDRRGRGESGDTLPYAVEREIEDIEALIPEGGGQSVYLIGHSSGASLALEAAMKLGDKVKKLALYEPPYNSDPEDKPIWKDYVDHLREALSAGRRGDAVAVFMVLVGMPANQINEMRQAPFWAMLEALAPTLAYDQAVLGEVRSVPTSRAASVKALTLVMNGSASYPFMADTARALTTAIPHAQHRVLEGQTHDVAPGVLAPQLEAFFGA